MKAPMLQKIKSIQCIEPNKYTKNIAGMKPTIKCMNYIK